MLTLFCLVFSLLSGSISFGMEKNEKAIITLDLSESCSFCLDSFSVQKGSIVVPYCGHALHGLCYIQWLNKCKNRSCFCGSPLNRFDEEGAECLRSYNNCAKTSYLQSVIAVSKKCTRFAFDIYGLIDEMCSVAYHYNNEN